MVDSFDFNTLDLPTDLMKLEELSQHTDPDTEQSTELPIFDNYELNFFSQSQSQSQSLSQQSQQSSQQSQQSVHNQCSNCGAQNTLQIDDNTGHKICTQCSRIVQDYQDLQSSQIFGDEDSIAIADISKDIIREKQRNIIQPLNQEIIRPQKQFTKLILNAFQHVLQSQVSVLIHTYNVKPHLYQIVGQLWFRFLNKVWLKKGFGATNDNQSEWVWNKNHSKLHQNNDFREQWITPKQSQIDVFLTTEDSDFTSSPDEKSSVSEHNPHDQYPKISVEDRIDFDALLSDTSNVSQQSRSSISSQTSISLTKSSQKRRKRRMETEGERAKRKKRARLAWRRILPQKCSRFMQRIPAKDPFGYKRRKNKKNDKNLRAKCDQYSYEKGDINLELSLVLLYIGCRICAETITMNDIILAAQKCIIPYLRAFECLPKKFRICDSTQRRKLFVTDGNYVFFKKFFQRNEMKYDSQQFYSISNQLIRDLALIEKIVPFNSKLMVVKYLRDLNIPLCLLSVIEIFVQRYKSFGDIFCVANKHIDSEWKELSEYGSMYVGYTNTTKLKQFDFAMKMIFSNGVEGHREDSVNYNDFEVSYKHLSPVTIMSLIVIGVLCIYRFDKCLKHKLNENPVVNQYNLFKKLPSLSTWFDGHSKYKYVDCKDMSEVCKMFDSKGGLENANVSWICSLTKDFIVRHYGIKPHFELIDKFIQQKAQEINKKHKDLYMEYKDEYNKKLNGQKSFNSLNILDEKKEKIIGDNYNIFEYHGYDAKHGNYSALYLDLMLLCSGRIGIKFEDFQKRLEKVLNKLKIVFEYNELNEEHVLPAAFPLNSSATTKCNKCNMWYGGNKIIECYNENINCDIKICRKCLMREYNDKCVVEDLLLRNQCGILKKIHWKCLQCQGANK